MARYDDGIDACRIRRAQAGTEVVRVLDAVEYQQQQGPSPGRELRLDEGPERRLVQLRAAAHLGNDALVTDFAAHLLEPRPVRLLDLDAFLAGARYQCFDPRIGAAVLHTEPSDLRFAPREQLLHGAQAGNVARAAHRFRPLRRFSVSSGSGRKSMRRVSMSTRWTCTCMASPRLYFLPVRSPISCWRLASNV